MIRVRKKVIGLRIALGLLLRDRVRTGIKVRGTNMVKICGGLKISYRRFSLRIDRKLSPRHFELHKTTVK